MWIYSNKHLKRIYVACSSRRGIGSPQKNLVLMRFSLNNKQPFRGQQIQKYTKLHSIVRPQKDLCIVASVLRLQKLISNLCACYGIVMQSAPNDDFLVLLYATRRRRWWRIVIIFYLLLLLSSSTFFTLLCCCSKNMIKTPFSLSLLLLFIIVGSKLEIIYQL